VRDFRCSNGYSTVKDALVWEIVQADLLTLRKQVADLLREIEGRQR
jgi:uncharacterized protein with HEPN domain